jgi:hypothetical protein
MLDTERTLSAPKTGYAPDLYYDTVRLKIYERIFL